jgi:hypothetical protein
MMLPYSGMLYVTNLPRPDNNVHDDCTDSMCRHMRVNEMEYKTAHHGTCVGYDSVGPEFTQLATIFQGESFPVIDPSLSATDAVVALEPVDEETSYVAISRLVRWPRQSPQ